MRGNDAIAAKNYAGAVTAYSEAILLAESQGAGKDVLRALYSNRSAAYSEQSMFDKALSDGKKCVSIDPQWAKGHSRMGHALYFQGQYTDSYNSYNAVVRLEPNNKNAQDDRDRAMNALANQNERTSRSSGSASGSSPRPVTGWAGVADKYIKYLLLLSFVVYVIPLGSISRIAWRVFAGCALTSTGLNLFSVLGIPRLSMIYAQQMMQAPGGLSLLTSLVLLTSRPYILAGLPFVIMTGAQLLVDYVKIHVPPGSRFDPASIPQMAQGYLGAQMPQMQAAMDQISSSGGQRRILDGAAKLGATMEIYQGMFLVIELALPTRNIMLLYLWWQLLLMRFVMEKANPQSNGVVKQAFTEVDAVLTKYLAYPIVPQLLRTGYAALKKFMAGQVDSTMNRATGGGAEAAGGGGGIGARLASAAKGCTVM